MDKRRATLSSPHISNLERKNDIHIFKVYNVYRYLENRKYMF